MNAFIALNDFLEYEVKLDIFETLAAGSSLLIADSPHDRTQHSKALTTAAVACSDSLVSPSSRTKCTVYSL